MASAITTTSTAIDRDRLPTVRTLMNSTGIAIAVAVILAVTCVLPAEYAFDPTGIGRVLGLTEMGEIKRDAELKKSKRASLAKTGQNTIRIASVTHVMNDAAPIGGAWSQVAQSAPLAVPAQM